MPKKSLKGKYLRFSEETNALYYLERAGVFIQETTSDPKAWKWVILALHGALYGFAICACKGSSNATVIRKNKKGHEKLITLDEALKMCQDKTWMGTLHGGLSLNLSASQADSIRRLKATLRNNFEHFTPKGWSIEMHGFPQIAMDILDVIRFLSIETFRYQHLNQSQRNKIKSVVYQSKRSLKNSDLHLELLEAKDDKKA